jgi:proteasome lid subunit RPN8/RPN11
MRDISAALLQNVSALVIRRALLDSMKRRVLAAGGRESCGFLSGRIERGCALVEDVHFATNIVDSAGHFAIAPREHRAIVEGLPMGRLVVAVFHSHEGDPGPSRADVESMAFIPLPWLILGHTGQGDPELVSVLAALPSTTGTRHVSVRVEQ